MATRTISITDEAYKRLARLKKENESFSIVINRIAGKRDNIKLSNFAGILSRESADNLEMSMKKSREEDRRLREAKLKKIDSELR